MNVFRSRLIHFIFAISIVYTGTAGGDAVQPPPKPVDVCEDLNLIRKLIVPNEVPAYENPLVHELRPSRIGDRALNYKFYAVLEGKPNGLIPLYSWYKKCPGYVCNQSFLQRLDYFDLCGRYRGSVCRPVSYQAETSDYELVKSYVDFRKICRELNNPALHPNIKSRTIVGIAEEDEHGSRVGIFGLMAIKGRSVDTPFVDKYTPYVIQPLDDVQLDPIYDDDGYPLRNRGGRSTTKPRSSEPLGADDSTAYQESSAERRYDSSAAPRYDRSYDRRGEDQSFEPSTSSRGSHPSSEAQAREEDRLPPLAPLESKRSPRRRLPSYLSPENLVRGRYVPPSSLPENQVPTEDSGEAPPSTAETGREGTPRDSDPPPNASSTASGRTEPPAKPSPTPPGTTEAPANPPPAAPAAPELASNATASRPQGPSAPPATPASSGIPYGLPSGKKGFMKSPNYPNAGLIDVQGLSPDTIVKDPFAPEDVLKKLKVPKDTVK